MYCTRFWQLDVLKIMCRAHCFQPLKVMNCVHCWPVPFNVMYSALRLAGPLLQIVPVDLPGSSPEAPGSEFYELVATCSEARKVLNVLFG